ncbi:LuxR C-terminal-related transcriptional regulator [Crossiella cryophila]|uniref:HTH luxR-type domain-containing protein n=1 Tax=Crossiella cryophila TaxID=43355 RepID=A0A7W7CDK6_9PSEU|nr:LuxR C-terminal-related transcriptional regulator [Crossiella cryophila]MBB4679155.1 hypothetical protein [Crossiella cryophila]
MSHSQNRLLTPDLARGGMLALIALANSTLYLYGRPYGLRQHIVETGLPDRIVSLLTSTLVDTRAYPLFAALFAYGLARQTTPVARRRCRWLIVFGFAHALLLFPGDVLGFYGVLGLLLTCLTKVRDRTLLILATGWLAVVALVQGMAHTTPPGERRSHLWSFAIADPETAFGLHALEWVMTPFGIIGVVSAGWPASGRAAEGDPVRGRIGTARRLARDSLVEVRRAIDAPHPGPLRQAGLADAIGRVVTDWRDQHQVTATCVLTGDPRPLHPELEITLLRAAQETLANAGRHARADRVDLTLSYMEDVVVLDVWSWMTTRWCGTDCAACSAPSPTSRSSARSPVAPRLSPSVAARLLDRVRTPEPPRGGTVSNREIAAVPHISQATVKTHLLHLFAKLDAPDRAAAVAAGYQRGILNR